jgi:DNA-directed RNA polymerase
MRSGNTRKTIILRNKIKNSNSNSNDYVVDRRKQVESIIPNVIHSLDASHLMFVIRECVNSKILPIITVHDCFGTLPNQMFHLEQVIKKQFVILYTKENFLNKFHKKLLESIEDNNYIIFKKGERKGRKDKIIELLKTFDSANIKKKSSSITGKITKNKKSIITKEQQILNLSNKITKKFKNNNALVVFVDDLKFQKFPNSTSTKIESAYSFLEIPALPKLGKLDLTKVINSKYMIT